MERFGDAERKKQDLITCVHSKFYALLHCRPLFSRLCSPVGFPTQSLAQLFQQLFGILCDKWQDNLLLVPQFVLSQQQKGYHNRQGNRCWGVGLHCKATRTAASGSFGNKRASVKEVFFAVWPTYLLLQLWGRCTLCGASTTPTSTAAALCFSCHPLVGERHTPAAVTHTHAHFSLSVGDCVSLLTIDVKKKKKTALTAAEFRFSAASGYVVQRGFAAIGWDVIFWTGEGRLGDSAAAMWLLFISFYPSLLGFLYPPVSFLRSHFLLFPQFHCMKRSCLNITAINSLLGCLGILLLFI